jgi:hypothetical protein
MKNISIGFLLSRLWGSAPAALVLQLAWLLFDCPVFHGLPVVSDDLDPALGGQAQGRRHA